MHLLGTLPHRLDGLRSCSTAPTARPRGVAPETLRDAGAEVVVIGADPTG